MASAPPLTTSLAISTISVTLGVSLTITILFVTLHTSFVIAWAIFGSTPNATPPCCKFGQEILISIPAASVLSIAFANVIYSSIENPEIFTNTGLPRLSHLGSSSSTNLSKPTFSKPIELIIPAGVSQIRGITLPALGNTVTPLVTNTPSLEMSNNPCSKTSIPKHPDEFMVGYSSNRSLSLDFIPSSAGTYIVFRSFPAFGISLSQSIHKFENAGPSVHTCFTLPSFPNIAQPLHDPVPHAITSSKITKHVLSEKSHISE